MTLIELPPQQFRVRLLQCAQLLEIRYVLLLQVLALLKPLGDFLQIGCGLFQVGLVLPAPRLFVFESLPDVG